MPTDEGYSVLPPDWKDHVDESIIAEAVSTCPVQAITEHSRLEKS
ncbi:hypothetical protein [Rhodococcus marinonascens]|nr:hypothetical protein [Rhodococcus marinonascens]